MADDPFCKDHWINIDRHRLDRYQRMFQWNPTSSILYEPADIGLGHVVGDFGSGPGHTAIEFATCVGADGHFHALDINPDFVSQTRDNAEAARADLFEYIEVFYNRKRRHGYLGNISPVDFEDQSNGSF